MTEGEKVLTLGASESWRQVEELFFHCEGLAEDARSRFLDEACSDDQALRQRVERLLAAAESTGGRLEGIVHRAAMIGAEVATPSGDALERLGPFRILEVLGEGGMGTVYLGERADGTYQQRVAIKVVKQGLIGPHVEERFRRERQILARLEHPAVARLLDGGTTPTGLPYLVMEFVDGEPIDAYCDRHQLTVAARLALFRKVCAGVRTAHRNLVVHRDLKPSNILVTTDGQPKLLDFGISKLLEDDPSSESTALTILGQRVLTPEYASPEQIRDEPITTAVDIYALGLLLHRLLTGDRPYPLPSTRGEALRKAICDIAAERPSVTAARLAADDPARAEAVAGARATAPGRLSSLLAGDLDAIVSKALRKEPGDRYGSVELMSADVGRHLEGLPVDARRGGWRYRAGRFLRRNRVLVAAAGSVVLALALGLVGQTREARRANREAERANQEAGRANQEAERANRKARDSAEVANFLVELFDASDPTLTRDELTARQLLDRGVERIQEELAGQPLTQAHLMGTLGRVYHNRGLFREADALFAGALERRQNALPADHADVATSHLDLADNLRVLGRTDEAMPHYERAVSARRVLFGEDSVELAQTLNNMALGLIRLADYPRAEELLERVLDIRRQELGEHVLVAQSLHNLTLIASRQGDYRGAVARGRETLVLKSRVMPPDDPSTGRTMLLLAGPVQKLGDYDEAEQLLRRALAIIRNAWDETHVDVLGAQGDLAYVRHLQGDWVAAEARQREILARKREHLGQDHREVAITLDALGRQLQARGDQAGAETLFRDSLALRTRSHPENHPSVATAQRRLGGLLLDQGRIEEAEPLLQSALTIRRQALPPTHPDIADSLLPVAELLLDQGSPQAATHHAEEGLSILRGALPADHVRIVRAQTLLEALRGSEQPATSM